MNSYYVYQLRRADSEAPFYIGKGAGERLKAHFRPASLKVRSWKNSAIKSAVQDSVEVLAEILHGKLSDEEAKSKEKELISYWGRRDLGTGILTNMTGGGDGFSGRVKSSDERAAITARNKLMRHTPEARVKISNAGKGRVISAVTRAKMSASGIGGPAHTLEARAKISAAHKVMPKFKCPHCCKELAAKHLAQWHGDKCKQKESEGTF